MTSVDSRESKSVRVRIAQREDAEKITTVQQAVDYIKAHAKT